MLMSVMRVMFAVDGDEIEWLLIIDCFHDHLL